MNPNIIEEIQLSNRPYIRNNRMLKYNIDASEIDDRQSTPINLVYRDYGGRVQCNDERELTTIHLF